MREPTAYTWRYKRIYKGERERGEDKVERGAC
jgi:hypothetical protein